MGPLPTRAHLKGVAIERRTRPSFWLCEEQHLANADNVLPIDLWILRMFISLPSPQDSSDRSPPFLVPSPHPHPPPPPLPVTSFLPFPLPHFLSQELMAQSALEASLRCV